jgi:hypothetical protein
MKSIAFLTMFVLPGTFISTLFAMPLFDWGADSWRGVTAPRFWIYWVVTVPLTGSTLCMWWFWQRRWDRRNVRLDEEARQSAELGGKKEV